MQTKMQNVIKGLRWIPTIHSTYNTNIALRPPAEVAASQCRAQTHVMWRLCCCQSQLCCKFEQLPKHVNLLMFKRGRKGKYFFCIPYPENFITVSSLSYIWVYNIERGTQLCTLQAGSPSSKSYHYCIMLYSIVSGYFNFQHLWHFYILKGKMWGQFKSLITEAVVISRRSTEARVAWREEVATPVPLSVFIIMFVMFQM